MSLTKLHFNRFQNATGRICDRRITGSTNVVVWSLLPSIGLLRCSALTSIHRHCLFVSWKSSLYGS